MKILLSGFEPFGGSVHNVSWNAVASLNDVHSEIDLRKIRLPVVFGESWRLLQLAIEEYSPDAVICTGQAKDTPFIRVERVALNIADARIPDNQGNQPKDQPALKGAPNAWFSNLPHKEMVEKIEKQGIPAKLSYSAGTYVCNHVFFNLMNYINETRSPMLGGFIHVPSDEEESKFLTGNDFSGKLVTEALRACILSVLHRDLT